MFSLRLAFPPQEPFEKPCGWCIFSREQKFCAAGKFCSHFYHLNAFTPPPPKLSLQGQFCSLEVEEKLTIVERDLDQAYLQCVLLVKPFNIRLLLNFYPTQPWQSSFSTYTLSVVKATSCCGSEITIAYSDESYFGRTAAAAKAWCTTCHGKVAYPKILYFMADEWPEETYSAWLPLAPLQLLLVGPELHSLLANFVENIFYTVGTLGAAAVPLLAAEENLFKAG